MEQSSSFETNWDDLPNEIKIRIIEKMGNNSRLSLRLCSKFCQQIVDSVPFRKIQKLQLWSYKAKWFMKIKRSSCFQMDYEFESFEDLQHNLLESTKNIDYIRTLNISFTDHVSFQKLKLSDCEKNNLKVKELVLSVNKMDAISIIEQVESVILEKVVLSPDANNDPVIYNMQQIIHAKTIKSGSCSIQDSQLLELKSKNLEMMECKNLTASGINEYIQKCLRELDDEHVDFLFVYEPMYQFNKLFKGLKTRFFENSVCVSLGGSESDTTSKGFRLEIDFSVTRIEGQRISTTNKPNRCDDSFTILDSLRIFSNKGIEVLEKFELLPTAFHFDSDVKTQGKLTELFEKTSYIRCFKVSHIFRPDSLLKFNLCTPSKKQLVVGKLKIDAPSDTIIHYLQQIEPFFLKEIQIERLTEDEKVFDTPQVIHAGILSIPGCRIRDEQLQQLEAFEINFQDSDNPNLTYSGINLFLKKCISKLNLHYYCVFMGCSRVQGDLYQLYEGLDVLEETTNTDGDREYILKSPYPKFQIMLTKTQSSISWMRIESNLRITSN